MPSTTTSGNPGKGIAADDYQHHPHLANHLNSQLGKSFTIKEGRIDEANGPPVGLGTRASETRQSERNDTQATWKVPSV